jgi:hypothetical protein
MSFQQRSKKKKEEETQFSLSSPKRKTKGEREASVTSTEKFLIHETKQLEACTTSPPSSYNLQETGSTFQTLVNEKVKKEERKEGFSSHAGERNICNHLLDCSRAVLLGSLEVS